MHAAGRRTDRVESASGDCCVIPAISRSATLNADTRWLVPTWTALPSRSSMLPSSKTSDVRILLHPHQFSQSQRVPRLHQKSRVRGQ
jgi:hypothetical protein